MGKTRLVIMHQSDLFASPTAPKRHHLAALFSCRSDVWATPRAVVDYWATIVGPFALDVAANATNAVSALYYDEAKNGLVQSWARDAGGGPIWCNPPYSDINAWVAKAVAEHGLGATVVLLLPSRTDTAWFHALLHTPGADLYFLRRRLTFGNATSPAPFPSVVAVLR